MTILFLVGIITALVLTVNMTNGKAESGHIDSKFLNQTITDVLSCLHKSGRSNTGLALQQ